MTHLMFPTTFLQAPSATQPQYGSLEAMHDLDGTHKKKTAISLASCKQRIVSPPPLRPALAPPRPNSLLASSVSFAARQRHLDHTGSESDPQGVTLAVYLHADDALVVNAVDAAPGGSEETAAIKHGFIPEEQMLVLRGGGIRMWRVSRREISLDSGTRGG